jgi:hypothetical protein
VVLKTAWTVHALLGGPSTLHGGGAGLQTFRLPDGTHTTTRFLTGGTSRSSGWPLECERIGAGAYLLLHLGHASLSLHSLTDELDPAFSLGFPRLREALSDLAARLHPHKIAVRAGMCLIAPEAGEETVALLPKLRAQAKVCGLDVQALPSPSADLPTLAAAILLGP